MSVSVAVFASGGGSNLQSLLDHQSRSGCYRIVLLVSDREDAGALERARRAGVAARVITVKGRPPEQVESETLRALEEAGVQAILLAGYLRLIPPALVRAFPRRILNIHPALLPSFGGKGMWGHRVHEAVLASGASLSGPTVHFVDEQYDTGSILAQWPVPVRAGDTPDTLAARVLVVEHLLYPLAADHLCSAIAENQAPGRLRPPGSAFAVVEEPDPHGLARQIEAGLRSGNAWVGRPNPPTAR
jgi:formyltetrahydrofolate-dependent phosphoribosylglycinamide formyltransferase